MWLETIEKHFLNLDTHLRFEVRHDQLDPTVVYLMAYPLPIHSNFHGSSFFFITRVQYKVYFYGIQGDQKFTRSKTITFINKDAELFLFITKQMKGWILNQIPVLQYVATIISK